MKNILKIKKNQIDIKIYKKFKQKIDKFIFCAILALVDVNKIN